MNELLLRRRALMMAQKKPEYHGLLRVDVPRSYPSNTTSFDATVKRTFVPNTYVSSISSNNYYRHNNDVVQIVSPHEIIVTVSNGAYFVAFPLVLSEGSTYQFTATLSTEDLTDTGVRISFYQEDGTYIGCSQYRNNLPNKTAKFTVPTGAYYTLILLQGQYSANSTFSDIFLEEVI